MYMLQLYHLSVRSVLDGLKTLPHREATHYFILKIAESEKKNCNRGVEEVQESLPERN